MRSSLLLAWLSAAVLSTVPGGAARATATYQRHARTTSDVCANVDAQLKVNFLNTPVNVGLLQLCLCLSGTPALLNSNIVVETAVGLVGSAAVSAALTNMVNSAADHESCLYPDNGDPFCSPGSPCGFHCKNGFVPFPAPPLHPKDCVCPAPNKVCNGICGPFKACPSSAPKKREVELLQRRAAATCDTGMTACGVYGWQGLGGRKEDAWECIDTKADLESCGGCMVPFGPTPAHGVDCTAIPGVMDVACASGQCIVHRCQPGYVVSMDQSFCLHSDVVSKVQEAARFGLENVIHLRK